MMQGKVDMATVDIVIEEDVNKLRKSSHTLFHNFEIWCVLRGKPTKACHANIIDQGFESRWGIQQDTEMGYHPECQSRAILLASQHPNHDILKQILSQVPGRGRR